MAVFGHFPEKWSKSPDSGDPGRGFYINPSRGCPRDPGGVRNLRGPVSRPLALPSGEAPGQSRDPGQPGIPDPGSGSPGDPGRALRDPSPPLGGASEGLFYINPSRRGPAVPLGVPPWKG